jgi:sec-independent protein translocase protein TatB
MFNSFSFSELLTILLVIVIVFGPHRLPDMARRLGQWTSKARQSLETLRTEIGTEYKDVIEPLKDAREDIRGLRKELGDSARAVVSDLDDAAADVRRAVEPEQRRLTRDEIARGNAAGPTPARSSPDESAETAAPEDEDGARS